MKQRIDARARGYRDALMGAPSRRFLEHPDHRFAYDAGTRDGIRARTALVAGIQRAV